MSDIVDDAIKAVGPEGPQDWLLKPEEHAANLPEAAAPLKRILTQPAIAAIIARYNKADAAAVRAQAAYKRPAKLAAIASFLAIIVGSMAVLPSYALLPQGAVRAAGAAQFLLLILSLGASILVGWRKSFVIWMTFRAEAENARRELFAKVFDQEATANAVTGLPLLSLQLEYFRRYQLDVQRLYYARRGMQHSRAADHAWRWRIVALIFIVAASFPLLWVLQGKAGLPDWLGPFLNGLPHATDTGERLFLGIGLIASALQGLLAANAVISLDERNAARYLSTAENLETRGPTACRGAAASG